MAFVFTPVYQAPQYSPFGMCSQASRPSYRYRGVYSQPRRPQYSPFNHFFGQVDELLGEIDRQAQRQAHCDAMRKAHCERQQQRKRALQAKFTVTQNEPGWQVDGEFRGFEPENISIEVTSDYTLKVAGNTEWHSESEVAQAAAPAAETVQDEKAENVAATEATTPTLAAESDTESHHSYQATVEDDFEDLGAETSSLISASSASSTVSAPEEPKGKEKAVEEPATSETAQPQEEQSQQERAQGSFERTFKFPGRIDAANVRASFQEGTLRITVPKAPVQEVKKITIS